MFVHASGQWKKVKYLNTKQGDTWKLAYIGYDTTDIFLDEGEVLTSDSDAGSARGHDLHMGKITYYVNDFNLKSYLDVPPPEVLILRGRPMTP